MNQNPDVEEDNHAEMRLPSREFYNTNHLIYIPVFQLTNTSTNVSRLVVHEHAMSCYSHI
jgi:hypothetical protein